MNKSELFLFNEQIVQDYTIFKGHDGELGQISLTELLEKYRQYSFLDEIRESGPQLIPSDISLDELRNKSSEFMACEKAVSTGIPESVLIADLCRIILDQNERILEMVQYIPMNVESIPKDGNPVIHGKVSIYPRVFRPLDEIENVNYLKLKRDEPL